VRASTAQDIFQLGLLLYEAFSGTPLMDTWENDLASVLQATEDEVPISFRRIKDPVARYIITNCLRRDADSRFSVADVKNNLKQMWVTNHALTRVQHGIIE
jgi:serine/threonine protein kinase